MFAKFKYIFVIIIILVLFGCSSTKSETDSANSNTSSNKQVEIVKPVGSVTSNNDSNSKNTVGYNDVVITFSYNYSGNGGISYTLNGNISNNKKSSLTAIVNISCIYMYKMGNSESVFNGFLNQATNLYLYNATSASSTGSLFINSFASGVSCSYSKVIVNNN